MIKKNKIKHNYIEMRVSVSLRMFKAVEKQLFFNYRITIEFLYDERIKKKIITSHYFSYLWKTQHCVRCVC